MASQSKVVGVDVGGTFTDLILMDADGGDVRMLVEGPYIQPTWSGRRELSVTAPQKRPLSWGWVKETGGGMGNPR